MKTIQKLTLTFLAILALVSCGDKKKELTKVIPADAMSVMYVNTSSIADKSKINLFDIKNVKEKMNNDKSIDDKQKKILESFQKNINSLGISIKGDVYGFFSIDYLALVVEMNDKTKFENNLKQVLGENIAFAEIAKGVNAYSIPFTATSMAWDKDKYLIVFSSPYIYGTGIDTDSKIKELFTLDPKDQITSLKTFQEFEKKHQDISVYSPGFAIYNNVIKQFGISLNKNQEDALSSLSGARSISNISFETGEIKLSSHNVFEDEASKEKYNSFVNDLLKPIDAKLIENIPNNAIVTAAVGIDGAGLFNKLNQLDILTADKIGDEQIYLNIKEVLSSLENVVFSLNTINVVEVEDENVPYTYRDDQPIFTVLSTHKSATDVFNLLKERLSQARILNEVSSNTFTIKEKNMIITFGFKDNKLYITNDDKFLNSLATGKTYKHDIALPSNFATAAFGNLQQLSSIAKSAERPDQELIEVLELLDSYSFIASSIDEGEGSLKLKDKSKNSLAVMGDILTKAIDQKLNN